MKQAGVYRIDIGPRFYIGSSVYLRRRMLKHLGNLKAGAHSNRKMQSAYNKYASFEFTVVELCDAAQLMRREQALLDTVFDTYGNLNLRPGASTCAGCKHSEASKIRRAARNIGSNNPNSKITHVQRTLLPRRYSEGASIAQLCKEFGLGRTRVLRIVREAGCPKRHRTLHLNQVQSIRDELARGATYAELGAKFHVNPRTVYDIAVGVSWKQPKPSAV